MYDWIANHHQVLSVYASFCSVIIWLVYAQLLYRGFRRQRSPRLIINRGRHKDINALCLISNMSAESVFIEYIIAELETSKGTITMDVTDFEQEYTEAADDRRGQSPVKQFSSDATANTRQGPVQPGDFLHIGTFSELIQRIARNQSIKMQGHIPQGNLEFTCLTLRLIGIYGPEALPVGAERRFDLRYMDDHLVLKPGSWDTRQLVSLRQRYKLRKTVEKMNATDVASQSPRLTV